MYVPHSTCTLQVTTHGAVSLSLPHPQSQVKLENLAYSQERGSRRWGDEERDLTTVSFPGQ